MLHETKMKINESDVLEMLSIYETRLQEKIDRYCKRTGKYISFKQYGDKFKPAGWSTYNKINAIWWEMKSDAEYRLFEEV